MASKDKLKRFRENETFTCLYQPSTQDVLGKDHPLKGNWGKEVFGNDNPIYLELGCGKGEYTIALAAAHPECNFIGVDIKGARLWRGAKYATEHSMPNVAFLRTHIEFISSFFASEEVSGLWITFADPQLRRERKRLTSPMFLERYKGFLRRDGVVNLKTDSRFLHEYTKALAIKNDLPVLYVCNDIYRGRKPEGCNDVCAYRVVPTHFEPSQVPSSLVGFPELETLLGVQTFYEQNYLSHDIPITFLSFRPYSPAKYLSPNEDEAVKAELTRWEDIEVAGRW
ncbi:MAG: tRNA (guanosine(46)-N7)-methyltransferase TrmB [Bacteroidales bacterium]|nr:tRNA (guanosine(46)-N7)-methyltransferase TrmB [Bacteroidales bacterium]